MNPIEQELAIRKAANQLTAFRIQYGAAMAEYQSYCIIGCPSGQDATGQKLHNLLDLMLDAESSLSTLNSET